MRLLKTLVIICLCIHMLLPGAFFSDAQKNITPFEDIDNDSWYVDAVNRAYSDGITKGIDETHFAPDRIITRAEYITLLVKSVMNQTVFNEFEYSNDINAIFDDVPNDSYYAPYVECAYINGLTSGTGDRLFSPNRLITREEAAALYIKAFDYCIEVPKKDTFYSDINSVSEWAIKYINSALVFGIISGTSDTTLEPQKTCSRAEAVQILCGKNAGRNDQKHLWNYDEITVIRPTCVTDGYSTLQCKYCNSEMITDYIQATGVHEWKLAYTVNATCNHEGYELYKCNVCGIEERQNVKPAQTEFEIENPLVKDYMHETDYSGDETYTASTLTNDNGTAKGKYNRDQAVLPYIKSAPSPVEIVFDTTITNDHYILLNGEKWEIINRSDSSITVTNLIPGIKYQYLLYRKNENGNDTLEESGEFSSVGQVRMIQIGNYRPSDRMYYNGVYNCRDLGGWTTYDGKRVKYGLVFRSGEFDGVTNRGLIYREDENGTVIFDGKETLRQLGITNEIDLDENTTNDTSLRLENYAKYSVIAYQNGFTNELSKKNYGDVLRNICENLLAGKGSIFHCKSGKDRTGTTAFLLLGILGVKEDQISQDYELSYFCNGVSMCEKNGMVTVNSSIVTRNTYVYPGGSFGYYKEMIEYLNNQYSEYDSFTDKVVALANDLGISNETIEQLRALMLEDIN